MEKKEPIKKITFGKTHRHISAALALFSAAIFPITVSAIFLYINGVDSTPLEDTLQSISTSIGLLFTTITFWTDGKWFGVRLIELLTSPITLTKDFANRILNRKNKNKYPSFYTIGNFINTEIDIFKKITHTKDIKTEKFRIKLINRTEEEYLTLKIYPKNENSDYDDNMIFSLKILYDAKYKKTTSNIGYLIQDSQFYKTFEENAKNIITSDIINGLKKIIISNEEEKINKIKEIMGSEFNLKYKIEDTKFRMIQNYINNKFSKDDDLYIKDVEVKIQNILENIKNIKSQKSMDKILDEMQNHYLPKIFQSIDLYYMNKKEDQSSTKELLESWIESTEKKVEIITDKNKEALAQDLKVSLTVEKELLEVATH